MKSRELGINLSATLEEALKAKIAKANAENWAIENRSAIRAYNDFVDEHGCFSSLYRR